MPAMKRNSTKRRLVITMMIMGSLMTVVSGQQGPEVDNGPDHAVIERVSLALRDPATYHVTMELEPATSVRLVARVDGVIHRVLAERGEAVSREEEVVRLESGLCELELERAKAALQLAQHESEFAEGGPSSIIASDRVRVAELDVQIAEHRQDDTRTRVPFDGTITAIHVVPGQVVRSGDPLVTLSDLSQLTVDVPVSRPDVDEGAPFELRVEEQAVTGQITHLLPLAEEFHRLRDLFLSVTTARITVDNQAGELSVGQTVHSDFVPRHPVAEIPTAALLNADDGQRKVQVIREGYVRDVPIQLLGQDGDEYVFVSGRFGPADELVVKTSAELLDGTRVVPSTSEFQPAPTQQRRRPSSQVEDDDTL